MQPDTEALIHFEMRSFSILLALAVLVTLASTKPAEEKNPQHSTLPPSAVVPELPADPEVVSEEPPKTEASLPSIAVKPSIDVISTNARYSAVRSLTRTFIFQRSAYRDKSIISPGQVLARLVIIKRQISELIHRLLGIPYPA